MGKEKQQPSSQQKPKNSILNYFQKVSKPVVSPVSPISGTILVRSSPSASSSLPVTTSTSTPKESLLSFSAPSPSTPKSVVSAQKHQSKNDTTPKKRPGLLSPNDSKAKRVKMEQTSPNNKSPPNFTEGSLVWAKLEGYPWWPAMLRGIDKGEPFSRNNNTDTEYHVQFFDNPPSRAWIRKVDIKPYKGSSDPLITAARTDPSWIESCKLADTALNVNQVKRVEKYWVTFDENASGSDNDVQKLLVAPETPVVKKKRFSRVRPIVESSDEDEKVSSTRKGSKKKKVEDDDDDDFVPEAEETANTTSTLESEKENSSGVSEESVVSEDLDETPKSSKPKQSKRKTEPNGTPAATPSSVHNNSFRDRLAQFSNDSPCPSPGTSTNQTQTKDTLCNGSSATATVVIESTNWPHLKHFWLKPENIRDKNKRKMSDPDYDPKTLFIPKDFLDSLTPAVRQWWEMKSDHFDTILFFKLGKFYELYNMDAVIAVKELGFIFMKGETAHCGFPEIGYSRYASILVQNGHKVARVEQTETPDMMNERLKKQSRTTKFDKVVRREICQLTTKGIRIATVQDESNNPFFPASEYLYAVTEKVQGTQREFGVCFIDTSIGTFHISQFNDDKNLSRLRTLFSHYIPAQVLCEKSRQSQSLQELLNNLANVRKDNLSPDLEFWSGTKVLKVLAEGNYFAKGDGESFDPTLDWPDKLHEIISKDDNLGLTPASEYKLGLSAFGAIVYYLKESLVEHDILSLKQFEIYVPVDSVFSETQLIQKNVPRNKYMVLDGVTLRNLGIVEGPNSLFSVIDKCSTNFGKRLLRSWLCMPLAVPDLINERLDAVEDMLRNPEVTEKLLPLLKSMQKVDLERLLNKVHTLGSLHRSRDHPDSRAFMFDDKTYSKRRIENLTTVLKNFKICSKIHQELQGFESVLKSKVVKNLMSEYPDLSDLFDYFDNAFDHKSALTEGKIIPADGVDPEYDSVKKELEDIKSEANSYLKQLAFKLDTKITYFGSEKKRFQLEMNDKIKVGNKFEMSSNRKGFKRYVTDETKEFLARTLEAETNRDNVLKDITRRIFEQFDKHRALWSAAVSTISTLDVLITMSAYSSSSEFMTRPIVTYSDKPFVNIENGRHACIFAQDCYIPNDTQLGQSNFMLLTGPNMGGKSTLMRQLGVLCVLAQMGCYVPATTFNISVVDRIFTRIGAADNLQESTFFVELSETSSILKHSTVNSLVLVDELGRGTATFDGTAIAYGVAKKLVEKGCRTLFSTHYHGLVDCMEDLTGVELAHMACMVENENDSDPTQETITFLYKLASGRCPKSYGFNAAKLAGVDNEIIKLAFKKAKELEISMKKVDEFKKLCNQLTC